MRWFALLPCVLLMGFLGVHDAGAGKVTETKSALESDPSGWTDLLADKSLKAWKRVPIPPGSKLKEKNPHVPIVMFTGVDNISPDALKAVNSLVKKGESPTALSDEVQRLLSF